MVARNNILSFGSHQENMQVKHSNEHQVVISACRKLIASSFPQCFGFLNNLDDSLFKLAEQATNSQLQEDYFAIMRLFRIKQGDIKQSFTKLILDDFDSFWLNPPLQTEPDNESSEIVSDSELSLMQNDALEEHIAIKKISTKGDSVFGNELLQLNQRFAHILDIKQVIDNPLSTEQIVNHLQTVISSITSDIAIKLVTYKQFEQHAISGLATLYQELNDELIKHNILPKLDQRERKVSARKPSPSKQINNDSLSSEDDDAEVFENLRHLLMSLGSGNQQPVESPANISTMMSALSNLQHQPGTQISHDKSGAMTLPDLRQSLLSNLRQTQADGSVVNQSISHIDEDTMNVIAMLFEFVLEDRSIPAPIRALLARLQLPMLKVAITDKTFFSKKKHAARLLLNNLAKVSTGWDHTNGTSDILFTQIDSIVNTILTEFDTDMKIFTNLNEQLTQFMGQQKQSSNVAEQRIAKTTEGQEKLVAAEQEVAQNINQLLAQYSPVPKAVVTLIDDNWRKILKLRFLQKGKDSPEWKTSLALMEQLLWSVAPKAEASERNKLIEIIPRLLKSLRDALSGPSFNQHKITSLFKDLQGCHLKCLNGSSLEENELQTIEEQKEIENNVETLILIPEEKKVLSDEKALNTANELQVGTWLEVSANEQSQRMKFSWRSNLTGRCLFVTYRGLKAAELDLVELANWFQLGQAIILNKASAPLMDRALVSMKESIEKQSSAKQ